jgi:murein DD-endopeptidase MepM/ murein hydrolase activator NlpD
MKLDADSKNCAICGSIPADSDRRVLLNGKVRLSYCSQPCLRIGVRLAQTAQRKARRRRYALLLSMMLAGAGAGYLRHVLRRLQPPRPAVSAPAPVAPQPPPEPITFGPHWPPTDEDWLEQFAKAAWVYPLPGPSRHRAVSSRELLLPEPAGSKSARCRTAGGCGVDLGGELWGEHVYAAHDGVVDRLQRASEDAVGGIYVRIAHWGGVVFTQYFHLAAIPTHLAVGAHVNAGDVIGLLGDTGLANARAHLYFTLSIRPSSEFPEVYWNPEPLIAQWPVRTPERGSVAGLVSMDAPAERLAGTPSLQHHSPLPPAKKRTKHRGSGQTSTSE